MPIAYDRITKQMSKFMILMAVLLLAGCASSLKNVKAEKVTLCENHKCRYLTESDSTEELLVKVFNLLKASEGAESELFESDAKERAFKDKGISFYVQGGPIPARAIRTSVKLTDIIYIDRENMEIKFKVADKQSFLMIPVVSAATNAILSMKSPTDIRVDYSAVTVWVGAGPLGTSIAKTEWLIDYVDLDNRVIGAHYAIKMGGVMSFGGGNGYQLVKLTEERRLPTVADGAGAEPLTNARPDLFQKVVFIEASGDRVLEGGEEAVLRVDVENKGNGTAKDVRVVLSGNPAIVNYLGEKKSIGDILAGENMTVEFKAVLPPQIPSGDIAIKIDINEAQGFSPETKILRIATKQAVRKESIEVISELPSLVFTTYLKDQNNNRVLDGGEEVLLGVSVSNTGEGAAKDIQVVLSGNKTLAEYLGEKKFVGDIMPGEKKTVEFKAALPPAVPADSAMLKISLSGPAGLLPSEVKILKVAMRPKEAKEVVEVISEVNVDDIPLKTKNFERKEAFALVIGISKYREEAIPAVKYAARDAEIVAKYLENVGGIPRANIKLLTDAAVTKSDLEAYIEDWLGRRAGKDSVVFVYYAGHGTPDTAGKEAYIVPYEGHPDFPSKLYPLRKMYESLNKLPAREVVVMLDSCFSGTGGRSVTRSGARPLVISVDEPLPANGKLNVLTASTGSQISSDYDAVKHGIFTYFLLRGLRGEADNNGNGVIELGELYDYVKTNVSEKASLELNRDQTPVLLPSADASDDRLKMPVARIK